MLVIILTAWYNNKGGVVGHLWIMVLHSLQHDLMLLGVCMDGHAASLAQAAMRHHSIPSNVIACVHNYNMFAETVCQLADYIA